MERQELIVQEGISLEHLSKRRGTVMGIATCLIMALHIYQLFGISDRSRFYVLKDILLHNCEYGVDIFLLVSGFGLYRSLIGGLEVKRYYKKRLLRIYPDYILTLLIISPILSLAALKEFLLQITSISLWHSLNLSYWYVPLIVILYLMYPLIHRIVVRSNSAILAMIAGYIAITFILFDLLLPDKALLTIISDRVPIFLIGALAGKAAFTQKRKITLTTMLGIVLAGVISFTVIFFFGHFSHYRLLYAPLAIAVTLLTAYLTERLSDRNLIIRVLELIGGASYQIYLIHGPLMLVIVDHTPLLKIPNKTVWIVVTTIVSLIAAFVLKAVCDKLRKVVFVAK